MSQKALLVIDIQNDYFETGAWPLAGAIEASLKARKVLDHFRVNNLPIVHIQHLAMNGNIPFFQPETPGVEIHRNVAPIQGEKIIQKYYPNSFRETGLLNYLRSNAVTDLVITGMMSHMCVDATTRAAKDLAFNCTVIADACASRDLELGDKTVKAADVHTAFIAALAVFYADVINTDNYIAA